MLKPVIGLELHVELNSKSKIFSMGNNGYSSYPNSNVVNNDMGFPGCLPILNKECIKKGIKLACALNCTIPEYLVFDRKNYYYPDLPKGYQITQSHYPIGINGHLLVNENLDVLIHDIHLEEDTASLDHYDDYTLIDYNRSGDPLIEIVTEPCITSGNDAVLFLEYLRNTLRYTDVSLADTKLGQIRCDVNVSVKEEDSDILGTKVEIKNINSFANVRLAIDYEVNRQISLINEGKIDSIIQETRRYDEVNNKTIRMRSKVDSIDYKYFVEPNIPIIEISNELINNINNTIPILPYERKKKYVSEYNILDKYADIIVRDMDIADYFDECINLNIDAVMICNYLISNIIGYLNKECISIRDFYLRPSDMKCIIDKQLDNTISSKQAKDVFNECLSKKIKPSDVLSNIKSQLSNDDELEVIIDDVLSNNEDKLKEYYNGKTNLFDYFVGMVMKNTKGLANPIKTREILNKKLK